ncbi:MAG: hypothetical protein AABX05_03360, partial [Nanoarchaeota archaeon]
QCNIPFQQQQAMAEQAITNQYGALGYNDVEGAYYNYQDLDQILGEISAVSGVYSTYWVLDGGKADGFGAFTFPASTLVFHVDTSRMAYAVGDDYFMGISNGWSAQDFRWKLQQDVSNIQFTPLGPDGYDPAYIGNDEAVRFFSLSALAGVAAHEASHIYNNDVVERMCLTYQNGNPYLVAAFGKEQERQADITAANFIADAYLQNPEGLLQPYGMILTMEIIRSFENITGPSSGYPSAAERMANVMQVFAERSIEVKSIDDQFNY